MGKSWPYRAVTGLGNLALRLRYPANSRLYAKRVGHPCRYLAPRTFTEKMQWRKLFDHNPAFVEISDKYGLRAYIARRGINVRMPEIFWYGQDPDAIPFDDLPDSYVLKPTHLSGPVLFCTDHQTFDRRQARFAAGEWMQRSHGAKLLEWANARIPRGLIVEEFIQPVPPAPVPMDYKIKLFGGEPYSITVTNGRFHNMRQTQYDVLWNKKPWRVRVSRLLQNLDCPKPLQLEAMIAVSREIARDFDYLRIDFYLDGDEPVLGELTPYSGSGYVEWSLEGCAPGDRTADMNEGSPWQLPSPTSFADFTRAMFGGQ